MWLGGIWAVNWTQIGIQNLRFMIHYVSQLNNINHKFNDSLCISQMLFPYENTVIFWKSN